MLVTRDSALADTVRALRNQGRRQADGWLDHALLGYNYRLSEINCALGVSQMRRIEAMLARRKDRALCYAKRLRAIPQVILPVFDPPEGRVCWFVFVIRLADRDRIADFMAARGIACGRYFAPVHRQPLYASACGPELPVTDRIAARTLALPFFNRIADDEVDEVCETLHEAINATGHT